MFAVFIGATVGFLTYNLSKILEFILYQPLEDFDKIRSQLCHDFTFWANAIYNLSDDVNKSQHEAQRVFREHSASLGYFSYKSKLFHISNLLINKVKKEDINNAKEELMGFSNLIMTKDTTEILKKKNKIKSLLRV